MIFGIPQATIQDFVPSVLVVPAIALVLGSPLWVAISAVCIFVGVALRAGGTDDYVDPMVLTVSRVIIGAQVLSRIAVDNVQRLAEAKREAEDAKARAEAASALMQRSDLFRLLRPHMRSEHVGKELVIPVPVARVIQRDDKEAPPMERL